jgi:glycine oxidase
MPRNEAMRATVVGAGVVGLTTALALAERGAQITLVERSREIGGNASWLAGGMLAPFCEGESAPQSVVELGQSGIDWWDARVPGVTRKGTIASRRGRLRMRQWTKRASRSWSRILAVVFAEGCSSRMKAIWTPASHCRR